MAKNRVALAIAASQLARDTSHIAEEISNNVDVILCLELLDAEGVYSGIAKTIGELHLKAKQLVEEMKLARITR